MPPDLYAELVAGLQQAAAGAFTPRFYCVKVSPRREKRYRRPGLASKLSPLEARAIQAFQYFGGCSITELAQRFHRHRRTIRKALRIGAFAPNKVTFNSDTWGGTGAVYRSPMSPQIYRLRTCIRGFSCFGDDDRP